MLIGVSIIQCLITNYLFPFPDEDVAIQAVHEINGTILSGRPVIAQFGRNSNRIEQIIV